MNNCGRFQRFNLIAWVAPMVCAFALVGCKNSDNGGDATSTPGDGDSQAAATHAPIAAHPTTATRENLLAKLAKADAYDGKVDKVVSRCAGCALGMDGSDKYVVEYEGYSLHLCNEACRKQFAGDTVNAVLAMSVPAGKP